MKVNGVFVRAEEDQEKPFCYRCRRNMHDFDGVWACTNCGKGPQRPGPDDEKILTVDTYDPILVSGSKKYPKPADFPETSKVLGDKEISPIDGEEKDLAYD